MRPLIGLASVHALAPLFYRVEGNSPKDDRGQPNQQQANQSAHHRGPLGKWSKGRGANEGVQVAALGTANDRKIEVSGTFNGRSDQVVAAVLAGTVSLQGEFGWFRGDGCWFVHHATPQRRHCSRFLRRRPRRKPCHTDWRSRAMGQPTMRAKMPAVAFIR